MKTATPYWSIIVPVYNESRRLDNLDKILSYVKKLPETWELIFVNDGSTDDTLKKLENANAKDQFEIVSYATNQGKGYAVKEGMLFARGQYRLFLDLDLSTPIEEIDILRPQLTKADVIIGTRKTKGSTVVVHQPWLRENLGKGFTFLSQVLLGLNISDFTCGFKCFSAEAAQKVFSHALIYRWGFDSEILFLAHKYGFSIKEIPVTWKNDALTRVKFPQDLITSLTELLRIRTNDLYNRYR